MEEVKQKEVYVISKEQFTALNILLDDVYEFFEIVKAEEMKKKIADFDREVFDVIKTNQKRYEED